jgi:hypothetical protein
MQFNFSIDVSVVRDCENEYRICGNARLGKCDFELTSSSRLPFIRDCLHFDLVGPAFCV